MFERVGCLVQQMTERLTHVFLSKKVFDVHSAISADIYMSLTALTQRIHCHNQKLAY